MQKMADAITNICGGKCEVAKGEHASPKMTLTADSADYVKIFTGEIDGMQAFMQGKLKLAGDLNLAMKLTQHLETRFGSLSKTLLFISPSRCREISVLALWPPFLMKGARKC